MSTVKFTSSFCLLGFAALMACGGSDKNPEPGTDGGNPNDDAGPPGPPAPYCSPKNGTTLKLTEIARNTGQPGFVGLDDPVFVTSPPNDGRLFVVERTGAIRVVKEGVLLEDPFLSLTTNSVGDEQGLLGLAFHPQYAQNGKFYVHYVLPGGNRIRVAQYTATPGSDVVTNRTQKIILETAHPDDNHNGGTVAFGPDGFLYISLGDGGGANDSRHNGQNRASVLAKILRIDVDGGDPYAIPPTNPWANTNDAKETYVWGLRNPYRFFIDRTGDIWIGDVGQAMVEELDVVRAGTSGQNFGWPVFEGETCFIADDDRGAGCDQPDNYVMPVTFRMRGASASILAGPVYRGGCMPDMTGRVFFGDYATGEVRSFPASQDKIAYAATTDHSAALNTPARLEGRFSSFGTDAFGEIYVMTLHEGQPAAGRLYRIEVE